MAKYALIQFSYHVRSKQLVHGGSVDLSFKKGEMGLTDGDMKTLADLIKNKHFPHHYSINLRGNHITDKGAEILHAAILAAKRTNLKINYTKTDITKEWRDKLQAALDSQYNAIVSSVPVSKGGIFAACLKKSDSSNPLMAGEIMQAEAGCDLR